MKTLTIIQLTIMFTGVIAVWLSLCKADRVRRWGPVFGLAGQPFWVALFWKSDQHIMLGICALYTFTWARGFWMFWIKPWRETETCCVRCFCMKPMRQMTRTTIGPICDWCSVKE